MCVCVRECVFRGPEFFCQVRGSPSLSASPPLPLSPSHYPPFRRDHQLLPRRDLRVNRDRVLPGVDKHRALVPRLDQDVERSAESDRLDRLVELEDALSERGLLLRGNCLYFFLFGWFVEVEVRGFLCQSDDERSSRRKK